MQVKQTFVTAEGLQKLNEELEYLKTTKRQEIAANIKEARSFGDLSENSEYDEAKNEQGAVEKRIAEIENILKNIKIIDENDSQLDFVNVGSKVKVYDETFDEEVEYTIVGSTEADPVENKISDESPVGKGLIGSKTGDVIVVEAPGGEIKLKVLEILR